MTAYRFIEAEKARHAIQTLCRALQVSRSAFYAWRSRAPSDRELRDRVLTAHIRAAHSKSRGTYGRPRVHAELVAQGVEVGERRVGRLMRQEGLSGVPKRRFRRTTRSDDSRQPAPNVLQRKFTADRPNEAWVTDITYVQVGSMWLYVAVIIDLFSRKVVGWAAEPHLRTDLCLQALRSALATRQPEPGLVHHSDRGTQYTSSLYLAELARHGIVPSMSRRGDCWDNAVAESFFGTLKTELVHRRAFRSLGETRQALGDYIHRFYNADRRHRSNGQMSPNAYEEHFRQVAAGPAA